MRYAHIIFEGIESYIIDVPHPQPTITPNAMKYYNRLFGVEIEANLQTNLFFKQKIFITFGCKILKSNMTIIKLPRT